MSVPVKGKSYHNPSRSLEIFFDFNINEAQNTLTKHGIVFYNENNVSEIFLPKAPSSQRSVGNGIYQPPFVWEDSSPLALAINFTYNTNALYRIFSNLADNNLIPQEIINSLIDKACLLLSYIYKANDNHVLRFINNNINMYILSKIVESLVGREIYNPVIQEPLLTSQTLNLTLNSIAEYTALTVKQKMAVAMGRGIAFLENVISLKTENISSNSSVENQTYRYIESPFAVDDRDKLIEMVESAKENNKPISMCAILDDTSESVLDLLWMQHLLDSYNNFNIQLLLNTAQISINFSYPMLETVLASTHFKSLASKINSQVFVHKTYCPLISFQTNFISKNAWEIIDKSDFLYIKGLNFFETCQNMGKDAFYAFVVYGPISSLYTGLINFDPVFAFIPKDKTGYIHNKDHTKIKRLIDIVK